MASHVAAVEPIVLKGFYAPNTGFMDVARSMLQVELSWPDCKVTSRVWPDDSVCFFANDVLIFKAPLMIREGPFAGAFRKPDGGYVFIPSVLRYRHNRPFCIQTAARRTVEYRSEYPNKPGRSTSTVTIVSERSLLEWAAGERQVYVSFLGSVPMKAITLYLDSEGENCSLLPGERAKVREWMDTNFMPDLGTGGASYKRKKEACELMLNMFLEQRGADPDDIANMEVDTPNRLLIQLLHLKLRELTWRARGNLMKSLAEGLLTNIFTTALYTGRWSMFRSGVSCQLKTTNQQVITSQIRRVMARQANTKARVIAGRAWHRSMFGFICPAESPDGDQCGFQMTFAATVKIDGVNMTRRVYCGGVDVTLTPGEIKANEHIISEYYTMPQLSLSVLSFPDSNRDQGPRTIFAAMMRRMFIPPVAPARDTAPLVLETEHGQVALVESDGSCDGTNVVAMILAQDLNLEDAIMVNQGAVDRGLFRVFITRRYTSRSRAVQKKRHVREGDLLDDEKTARADETGIAVDVVTSDGAVNTTVVTSLPLKDGDKLSNRHGQKGVCRIVPTVDMPFCVRDGVVPDLVVNPYAFPGRMTLGQLSEMERSMEAVMGHIHEQERVLARFGVNGEMVTTPVTVGLCWYGRMEQMSTRKVNVRSDSGPRDPITNQPVQGRRNLGGTRFSLMDANAVLAHGAVDFLDEAMRDASDPAEVWICSRCHLPCPGEQHFCRHCKTSLYAHPERTTTSTLVMMNELQADGISTRLL